VNRSPGVSPPGATQQTRQIVYEIILSGEMGALLRSAFPDLGIETVDGRTHLTAHLRDEAELLGLLDRLHCFHLHVEAMAEVGAPRPGDA
jgi:hypothetical protein